MTPEQIANLKKMFAELPTLPIDRKIAAKEQILDYLEATLTSVEE